MYRLPRSWTAPAPVSVPVSEPVTEPTWAYGSAQPELHSGACRLIAGPAIVNSTVRVGMDLAAATDVGALTGELFVVRDAVGALLQAAMSTVPASAISLRMRG